MNHNTESTTVYDLSSLGVARVSGKDASDFLQGQFSNDIQALNEAQPHQLAAYCNPKGRMLAIFHVLRLDHGAYALLAPHDIMDKVLPRLKMFVMRAAVDIRLDEGQTLLGVNLAGGGLPEDLSLSIDKIFSHSLDPTRRLVLVQRMPDSELLPVDDWNGLDIRQDLPQVFIQTCEAFIPQSLNLDIVGGVNFKKGCYPGQEIIARVKYRGKPKTRMIGVAIQTEKMIEIGAPIFIEGRKKSAGQVANIARDGEQTLLSITVPVTHLSEGSLYLDEALTVKLERLPCPYDISV